MIFALLSAVASASWKICVGVTPNWADFSQGEGDHTWDDYLDDNSTIAARGIKVKVKLNGGVWQWAYARDEAPDVGCATFDIMSSGMHTVAIESVARVDGHVINAFQDNSNPIPRTVVLDHYWDLPTPNMTGTKNETLDVAGLTYQIEWNTLAAASWALHHRDGGLPADTWTFYSEICPGSDGSSCFDNDGDVVFTDSNKRSVILHELGHYLWHRRIGTVPTTSFSDFTDDCVGPQNPSPAHALQHKEWQAMAFNEGFANFYAMVSTNNETESSCAFIYYRPQDFDFDGDNDPLLINCNGVLSKFPIGLDIDDSNPLDPAIGATDYLRDAEDDLGCSFSTSVNHATELDWDRFLWQLYSRPDLSLNFGDILDMLEISGPTSWTGNTTAAYLQPSYPTNRLHEAAEDFDTLRGTSIAPTVQSLMSTYGVSR